MAALDFERRPSPEALLAALDREQGGGLKIFLGAAPGVGKTYAMLHAAQEARRQGRDLVIGVVECHGRAETEVLCQGIEAVPLQPLPYAGRSFEEFDLDAVIARRPETVLVDELAHRNIPGTRHPRRYQDIEELLGQGIDVWTTLNVQHLESLNDSVARISGVRMRETVPDRLLEKARDIVLVDLAPSELIERLRQGKVYVPEQARAAMDGFFSTSNLTALREMAFAVAANRVDADLRLAMQRHGREGPWPVRERVVIAIDGRRNAEQVVRAGKRIADRRRAPWTVIYVETGASRTAAERQALERAFQLAEQLGGQRVTLRGTVMAAEILAYARDQNATTIVIGRTRERPLAGLFQRTLTQRLLRENTDFEITIIGSEVERPAPLRRGYAAAAEALRRATWRDYGVAVLAVAVSALIAAGLERVLPLALPNLSLVFLTGVLVVAARTSLAPAMATAGMSFVAYNFFFAEPRLTLDMHHTHELVTVLFFLVMAIIGGNLASRLKAQVAALRATNAQSQELLGLNKQLAKAPDPAAVQRAAVQSISRFEQVPVCLLTWVGERNELVVAAAAPEPVELDQKSQAAADWAFANGQPSGYLTDTLSSARWRFLPLVLEDCCYAVLGIELSALPIRPSAEQLLLLDALVNQVTLSLARSQLSSSLEQARLAEETERLRSALLSSVSHDLRTPLASMLGSASTLRELGDRLSDEDKQELLDAVLGEGQRLNRYIENLLDMTRLGHGTLKLARDWVSLADLVGAALRRTRELFSTIAVIRDIPEELPLLYVHPALIEQALVNVIENAARFSPRNGELRIAGRRDGVQLLITVTDQGPGIPESDRKRVFDMFFSGERGDTGRYGSGLGLAICHGMIGAHGGSIEALAGPAGRGTTIAIRLPVHEPPADEDDDGDEQNR